MTFSFRTLRADEIDCRVQQVTEKGCILLLYKDARADMTILDETVTPFCWQRQHTVVNDNLFCTVSIYDGLQWIAKQDVGTESNTEKQKGEASDSFKRACVNWGIGRELYTSPFIWIPLDKSELYQGNNGKVQLSKGVSFEIAEIGYDEHRRINRLVVKDLKGKERFSMGKKSTVTHEMPKPEPLPAEETKVEQKPITEVKTVSEAQMKRMYAIAKAKGRTGEQVNETIKKKYHVEHANQINKKQYDEAVAAYEALPDKEEQ